MSFGPRLKLSEELHIQKYRQPNETFETAMKRISKGLSDTPAHNESFLDILLGMRFLPAGRVQAAIGAPKHVTAYNCFVSGTINDSFVAGEGSIMQRATEAAATMRMGGGIGYDFSKLRPRGDLIKGLDSQASGPLSFMQIYDSICTCIASSGHRRGAQMGVLRVDHPDIESFITAKTNTTELTGFNMSLAVTDRFMEAVQTGSSFDLKFEGTVYKTIDALELWEKIMRTTWDWAEPGVLFIDRINEMNNLYYCETIAATNPCVTGDTLILTNTGYKRIDSVVDQPTTIWNGNQWSLVTPKVTGYNQKILDITFSDGSELACTHYHGFKIAGMGSSKVEAKDLRVGDKLEKFTYPTIQGNISLPTKEAYTQGFYSGDGQKETDRIWLYDEKIDLAQYMDLRSITNEFASSSNRKVMALMATSSKPKDFVPSNDYSVQTRLDWLAGLIDSDGSVTKDGCVQICSIQHEFLKNVKYMLQTLGISAHIAVANESFSKALPDGRGGYKNCTVQKGWRMCISNTRIAALRKLGLITHRVNTTHPSVYTVNKFITIKSITERNGFEDKVYCFNEPLEHTGVFNGIRTSNCGEQPLPPYGACLLGSFNLTKYINQSSNQDKEYKFDWSLLKQDIPAVVRALDNVVDAASYPLIQQEKEAKSKRRMGLGITGLANAAEAMGFMYGSKEFLAFEGKVLDTIRDYSYAASAMLAKEKGTFPLYDARYLDSKFVKTLNPAVRELIQKYGIRNSHLTSIAPTGTISLTADNISSSIEPVFNYGYDRTIQTFDGPTIERVDDYGFKMFGVKGKIADKVTASEHIAALVHAATRVDSAVSKTCNVSPNMDWEEFKHLYVSAWEGGAKGCTTFNSGGKRFGILVAPVQESEEAVEETPNELSCALDPNTGRKSCE